MSLWVAIFLGETEVDDIDLVTTLADAHQEVVRLDVPVDEGLGVDVLDTRDKLIGQEEDGLQGKLPVAEVEEVLQTRTKQVEDHGIVVALGAEPADKGDADAAGMRLVDARLILELRVLGLDRLELDGNLLARDDVGAQVAVAKGAGANLTTDAVFVSDAEILAIKSALAARLARRQRRA